MRPVNGLSVLVLSTALLAGAAAPPGERDPAIPLDRMIAAIRTAVAAQPGSVHEAEVKRERGRTLVELKIVGADGRTIELTVDADTNEVVGWQK